MTTRAIVLAAGLGTRLRPLTDVLPKALVPVGDRPLLLHIIEHLERCGIRRVSVNAHCLATQLTEFTRRLSHSSLCVECEVEEHLLGTAGGVRRMVREAQEPALVWNGDIFAPALPLADLFALRGSTGPVLVVAQAVGQGSVGLDARGQVVRVRGERFGHEIAAVDYVGIALLPSNFITALPASGCLVGDALLPWLRSGQPVYSMMFNGFWSDGGSLGEYLALNRYWLRQRRAEAFVGENAELATGVHLNESVVGAQAVVTGAGEVSRCVIWPKAHAVAPLNDTVVLPDGTLVRVGAPLAS